MRHIGREELETLKHGVDLVELVRSHGTVLKKVGAVFQGHCPFPGHDDTTPSFTVDPRTHTYRCYGACPRERQSGDAIAFLRHLKGLTFQQAVDQLFPGLGTQDGNGNGNGAKPKRAARPSVSSLSKEDPSSLLKSDEPQRAEKNSSLLKRDELLEAAECSSLLKEETELQRAKLLDLVVGHYETTLAHSSPGQRYLDKRGLLVPDVLKRLRVGFSDGSLVDAIAPDGEQQRRLTELGVLMGGRDAFNGRVVVPLLDARTGAVLSLYGRAISGPRHSYLSGTRRGLVNGAVAMVAEELVVVESIFDAMSLLVLGIENVVPIYGTNGWTRDHDRLLSDGSARTVRLLLDTDDAGRTASASLKEELTKRGIVVHVASLPAPHKDPNDALIAGVTREQLRQVLGVGNGEPTPAALPPSPAEVPVPPSPASPRSRPSARYNVEAVAEGFAVVIGPRRYLARAIKGGGYERLTMTLVLEDGYQSYGDRLDLYVGKQRTGFSRRVARKFGYDEEEVERELEHVRHEGEMWVAEQARHAESENAASSPPVLTEDEKTEALALLKEPRLLDLVVEHMSRLGYVGEETNKALGYLIIVSRKLEDPLSALILSQSAAGKSGLTDVLQKMTPPEDVYFFSRITPAALYHVRRDFLLRKVVIIEERSGSEEADYSLRTLQSRKLLSLALPVKNPQTGKLETVTKEVLGPAVFLETTTSLDSNYENSTRCFELYLDESVAQTERIHGWQRWLKTLEGKKASGEADALSRLHHNAQRFLQPVRVHIGFIDQLTFPAGWLRTRRDHARFLNLIEASAFLYQYQRRTPPGAEPGTAVEATVEDYAVAYRLSTQVLCSTLSELRKPVRELLTAMKELAVKLGSEREQPPERVTISRRDIRNHTGLPDHQVRRLLVDLVDKREHVEKVRGSQGKVCVYRVAADAGEPKEWLKGLLSPDDLMKLLSSEEKR